MATRDPTHPAGLALRLVVGTAAGLTLGFLAGIVILRVAVSVAGAADGWEDLVAIAGSIVSFAPVGAIIGAALAARRELIPRWERLPRIQRRLALGGLLAGPTAAAVAAPLASDPTGPIVAGVMAMPLAGAAGLAVGTLIARARIDPPATSDPTS